MQIIYAEHALLPEGWREAVRIAIDTDGTIAAVAADAPADGAEHAAGPVIPGMANLHSHAFQRALAGLAEQAGDGGGDSFPTWRDLMYRFVAGITPEQMEAIARHLYVEMLKAGYTTVAEFHYLHHGPDGTPYADPAEMSWRIAAAAEAAGIGLMLLPVFYAHGGFGGQPPTSGQGRFIHGIDDYLNLLERLGTRLRPGLAFHSLRAATPHEMAAILASADSGGPIHIHAAEQRQEVDDCLAWSGARPVQWLLDHMPVSSRWCLIHATHTGPDEIRRLAASGAVAGLCPTTEANLGDGLFSARAYLEAEGRFGIGSDSHVSINPIEELRWLEYGQRLLTGQRNRLASPDRPSTGGTLYGAALSGGARALGRDTGHLAPGARADLVVLDGTHPLLAGCRGDRILDRLLFAGDRSMVRDVMAGGTWQVREGRHPKEQESANAFISATNQLLDKI